MAAEIANADAARELVYKLISSENDVYRITEKALLQSETLKKCVEMLHYTPEEAEEKDPIPVLNVASKPLKKVIEWCEKHREDGPVPDVANNRAIPNLNVTPWDREFLKVDMDELYLLILAADYLDIRVLLNMTCKQVADEMKGRPANFMRDFLRIPNDEEDEAEAAAAAAALNDPQNNV